MERYEHPVIADVDICRLFAALSDPVRLAMVRKLARHGALNCAALTMDRPRSTMSHHFRVLRAAGLVRTTVSGTEHVNALRETELEARFPGLLRLILEEGGD